MPYCYSLKLARKCSPTATGAGGILSSRHLSCMQPSLILACNSRRTQAGVLQAVRADDNDIRQSCDRRRRQSLKDGFVKIALTVEWLWPERVACYSANSIAGRTNGERQTDRQTDIQRGTQLVVWTYRSFYDCQILSLGAPNAVRCTESTHSFKTIRNKLASNELSMGIIPSTRCTKTKMCHSFGINGRTL